MNFLLRANRDRPELALLLVILSVLPGPACQPLPESESSGSWDGTSTGAAEAEWVKPDDKGECPSGFVPIKGIEYDEDQSCLGETSTAICVTESSAAEGGTGEIVCHIEVDTGETWLNLFDADPVAPGFDVCEPDLYELVVSASPCAATPSAGNECGETLEDGSCPPECFEVWGYRWYVDEACVGEPAGLDWCSAFDDQEPTTHCWVSKTTGEMFISVEKTPGPNYKECTSAEEQSTNISEVCADSPGR